MVWVEVWRMAYELICRYIVQHSRNSEYVSNCLGGPHSIEQADGRPHDPPTVYNKAQQEILVNACSRQKLKRSLLHSREGKKKPTMLPPVGDRLYI
ncbi:hypothetical protein AVEN_45078-1 [Araneus ventricosus]|uniref:Uncharacterized protein n=1 Tax=Araneus ventricosus TaxID=182803 RepID=A0A4Y2FQ02_ARAVE|nr:hypothetical protein AVEN_45078-1 [Araneus ventricosus]